MTNRTKKNGQLGKPHFSNTEYVGMLEVDESVLYVEVYTKRNNRRYMVAGTATNTGVREDYIMEYDKDFSLDENLQAFVELHGLI